MEAERAAARVVLLDEHGRVYLLEAADERGRWWFTPGGGREAGESDIDCARRELAEETGYRVDASALAGPIFEEVMEPSPGRVEVRQRQVFFAARVAAGAAGDERGWTEIETRVIKGARWWTIEELEQTRDAVYPVQLAELARVALTILRPAPPAAG